MTIEYAKRLLRKETSREEIVKLEFEHGYNAPQVVDTINKAIELLCNAVDDTLHSAKNIKNHCSSMENCDKCALFDGRTKKCTLTESNPEFWNIT